MKKLYILLLCVAAGFAAMAQDAPQPAEGGEKKQQDIEALRVAFISKELELTPAEAEKFWPVYNEYAKELKGLKVAARNDADLDELDRDEKILNLRKRYKERFLTVLGPQRATRLFGADKRFHQLLLKAVKHQQQRQRPPNPNRPFKRN